MIKESLRAYVPIADMLTATFGKGCEVVLHDLDDPEHSVVYVSNPSVTGRKIGESFHTLVEQVLLSSDLKENFVPNYFFHVHFKDGDDKLIRSSTLLIRKADGTLDGALCINLDTNPITEMITMLQQYLPPCSEEKPPQSSPDIKSTMSPRDETTRLSDGDNAHLPSDSLSYGNSVSDLVSSLIENILKDMSSTSTREERIEKIRFMNDKGVFLMKGSVEQVAAKMGINKVTVYSYLDEVRGKR